MRVIDPELVASIRVESCAWPGCKCPHSQVHHIYPRGMGGGSHLDIPENLLPLCLKHHDHVHREGAWATCLCWNLSMLRCWPRYMWWEDVRQVIWDKLRESRGHY